MPEVRDLAEALKAANESSAGRVSVGPNPTFGTRVAPILFPGLIPQVPTESLSFSSVDVAASGSAAVVAPGAAKPAGATVQVTPRTIGKIAATATFNAEAFWESKSVVESVTMTLIASCLTEEDKVANAALAAAAAPALPATTWIAAIAGGQARVNAAGGSPNLVVIPSADWPALAGEISASTGLTTPSSEAILAILGSRIVLSPEGTAAFVLDPAACVRAIRDVGFMIDTASGATTNQVTVVTDLVASVFVQVPPLVAAIAVSP